MNKIKFILCILVFAALPVSGADTPHPKFSKACNWQDFEYTLITPELLEMMPDKLSEKELRGISTSKLKLVEIVKTPWSGEKKELNEIVKQLKTEPGWQEISIQKKSNGSTTWFIKRGGGNKIKEILVLKYTSWGQGFYALYIVGNLTTEDLKKLFK